MAMGHAAREPELNGLEVVLTFLTPLRHACLDVTGIIEGRTAESSIIKEAHAGPRMGAARGSFLEAYLISDPRGPS